MFGHPYFQKKFLRKTGGKKKDRRVNDKELIASETLPLTFVFLKEAFDLKYILF